MPQTNTPRATREQGITVAMSSLTLPRGYASKEHWRRLDWMTNNGELMYRVCANTLVCCSRKTLGLTFRSAVWRTCQPLRLLCPHEHPRQIDGP